MVLKLLVVANIVAGAAFFMTLPDSQPDYVVDSTLLACSHGCWDPPPGCDIKGNVSQASGERIYHLPGLGSYQATVISPQYGERWFCTQAEAEAAGWRRALNAW